jgi:ubiquinone/menaquinone biosynthesis C-methylase UbiE
MGGLVASSDAASVSRFTNEGALNKDPTPICDYEGSDYQARFWENQGREYEDLVERIAIRRMLPPRGQRLLEVGTGFGRLVDLYQGYERLLLLDYSKSMLREAQQRLGPGPRHTYIAANLYHMPLSDCQVDAVCMVRVIHHLADVSSALCQIHRVLRPAGTFVLEFANKLHLKSVLRYITGRQSWSPYGLDPVEFVPLNFDFHPRWMQDQLRKQGFDVERIRTVSHFRLPLLKRLVPVKLLTAMDGAMQWTGQWWQYTPSVFVRCRRAQSLPTRPTPPAEIDPTTLFRCPTCEQRNWQASDSVMHCQSCGARWGIDDGIYDFKSPL